MTGSDTDSLPPGANPTGWPLDRGPAAFCSGRGTELAGATEVFEVGDFHSSR